MVSFAGAVKRAARLAAAFIKSAYVMIRFVIVIHSDIRIAAVGAAYEALPEQIMMMAVSLAIKRFTPRQSVISRLPEFGRHNRRNLNLYDIVV